MSEIESSNPVEEQKPDYPRPATDCSGLIEAANKRIQGQQKHFVIKSSLSSGGICAGEGCEPIEVEVRPCFELRWGDGPHDQLETDDFEVLYIVASNPYVNVLFKDVTIVVSDLRLADGQKVPLLPDGTSSADITPTEFICFGDLPPADEGTNQRKYVSREVVLVSRGAKPGWYTLSIGYCYSIETFQPITDEFKFELIAS
jgi:hypothetical protein